MEALKIIGVAVFLGLIIIEAAISMIKQLNFYKRKDTVVNLVLAVISFVTKITLTGFFLFAFISFHQYAIFNIGYSWWSWIVLFFITDFIFYAFHRLSHECRLMWASHVTHHSSQHYNFSTAMRGNFIIVFYHFIFLIPLCLLGFEPLAILLMDSIAFFYQLLLHTKLVKKLFLFEFVFNTPSHHRVHHGSNDDYINKNYGAILIIWDRIFGSFQEEKEQPVYGLTKNIHTNNPIKILFHEWASLFRYVVHAESFKAALRYIFDDPSKKAKNNSIES